MERGFGAIKCQRCPLTLGVGNELSPAHYWECTGPTWSAILYLICHCLPWPSLDLGAARSSRVNLSVIEDSNLPKLVNILHIEVGVVK